MTGAKVSTSRTFLEKVALGVLLINLVAIAMAGFSLFMSRQTVQEQAEVTTRNLAQVLEWSIRGTIRQIDLLLLSVVDEAARPSPAQPEIGHFLAALHDRMPTVIGPSITDEEGLLQHGQGMIIDDSVDLSAMPYFQQCRDAPHDRLIIASPILTKKHGWVLPFIRRLHREDGRFAGIAHIGLSLKEITKIFSTIDVGEGGSVAWRDEQMSAIARFPEPQGLGSLVGNRAVSETLRKLLLSQPVMATYEAITPFDGIERTLSYRKIAGWPHYVLVGLAKKDYLAKWWEYATQLIFMVSLIPWGSGILFWMVWRTWQRREEANIALQRAMERVEKSERESRRSHEFLEKLFNTTHLSIVFLDREFNFIRVNRAYAESCAFDPDYFPGKNHFTLYPHTENEAIFRRTVESGHPFTVLAKPFEFPDHPEWGVSYWDWTLYPIKESDGQTQWLIFILRDVTEDKKNELALIQAKEEAERANQAKSAFLAAMSHEIRTPMNVVIGMGDVLQETPLEEEQREYVRRLQEAGNSLLELINQILDLSKIESGVLDVVEEPVHLESLAQETVDLLRVVAVGKGLRLEFQLAPGLPTWIIGDKLRLRQILFNLLGNAIKFTEQGQIVLRLQRDDTLPDRLHWTVEDTGIGIPKDQMETIFDIFTQADSSITRRYGGTGLGLSISRRLTELMKGNLWGESNEGRGSIFHIVLPLRPCAAPAPAASVIAADQNLPRIGISRPILLVDDSEDNRALIASFLKKSAIQLITACDGAEAVALIRGAASPFAMVFMDVQMPVMDGYSATRMIRQWEQETERAPLPIIALTAHALGGEEERSRKAGCDLYLTKPIKKQRLLEVIQQFAGGTTADG